MSFLDLARDGAKSDGDFAEGIPATGAQMSSEMANFAFNRWDQGRRLSQIRAALSNVRKMTPTGLGGGGTASYDAFQTIETNQSDVAFYVSQADLDDLMRVSLPDGTVSTFIADSGTNFQDVAISTLHGEVGDGRLHYSYFDLINYKTVVFDPRTAAFTAYTDEVVNFLDPRFGGETFCYLKPNGDYVSTNTIGSAESVLDYSVDGLGIYDTAESSVYLDGLGLFQLLKSPLDQTQNTLVWSRRGAHEVTPVVGIVPNAFQVFSLGDRMITSNGILCEDHRKGSQVQIRTDENSEIIGARSGAIYAVNYTDGVIHFNIGLLQTSWKSLKLASGIEAARLIHNRIWYKLTGSADWYFTGVLP